MFDSIGDHEKSNLDMPTYRKEITQVYEVRARADRRGADLISDALPFGRLWYGERNAVSNAIGSAIHSSRSHHAVIPVYNDSGNVIETQEHKGDFKEP